MQTFSLTLINGCPARASYRLELKRQSPPARHRTTECSAVSGVISVRVYQNAPQHSKGNSAQPCAYILSSPEGHRETMDKECPPLAKCCQKALGCPNVKVSCGLAAHPEEEQRMSRGCLCVSSTGSKAP